MMLNSLILVGRLGQDPELKYFDSGSVKATFSVAVDRPSKEKTTDWFNVEVWGKTEKPLWYVRQPSDLWDPNEKIAAIKATLAAGKITTPSIKMMWCLFKL
jgi:hypothetical protein